MLFLPMLLDGNLTTAYLVAAAALAGAPGIGCRSIQLALAAALGISAMVDELPRASDIPG